MQDIFTYEVVDIHGAADMATLTITATGVNDGIVVSSATTAGVVVEDASNPDLTTSGVIAFTDADLLDVHTVSASYSSSTHGAQLGALTASITNAATGDGVGEATWTFAVDNAAVQFLSEGEQLFETYSLTLTDSAGGTSSREVTIAITGKADGPTVSGPISGGTTDEDVAPVSIDLLANATTEALDGDLDIASVVVMSSNSGRAVTFSAVAETGLFTLDPAQFDDLAVGESETLTIAYNVVDNLGVTPATASLVVEGRNDAVTISSIDAEGDAVVDVGSLDRIANGDLQEPFIGPVFTGSNGQFTVGSINGWSSNFNAGHYEPNSSVLSQLPNVGSGARVAWINSNGVISQDVGVLASNETYRISFDLYGTEEAGGQSADGSALTIRLFVGGQDVGFNQVVAGPASGTMQSFEFDFAASDLANVSALEGQALTLQLSNQSTQPSGAINQINVDNIAVHAFDPSESPLSAAGALSFEDVDLTDAHTISVTPVDSGYVGTFSASITDLATGDGSGAGAWEFQVDSADLSSLGPNEIIVQEYDVTVDDGEGGATTERVAVTLSGEGSSSSISDRFE